jgi:NAD(P)-dependent dehydrogenase (short-subunit alcohol dehydrogenase family)
MTPKRDHGEESYKGCDKLEGRATIITGGDSGIGRAVAIAFAREGADVLISYEEGLMASGRPLSDHLTRHGHVASRDHASADIAHRCRG